MLPLSCKHNKHTRVHERTNLPLLDDVARHRVDKPHYVVIEGERETSFALLFDPVTNTHTQERKRVSGVLSLYLDKSTHTHVFVVGLTCVQSEIPLEIDSTGVVEI